jgi:hypothetical protein
MASADVLPITFQLILDKKITEKVNRFLPTRNLRFLFLGTEKLR